MFDLFRSSDKVKKYILGGLLTLVALSMVTYLIPNYSTGTTTTDNPVLAEIAGRKITSLEAQQLFQKYSNGRIPPELLEIYLPQFVYREVGVLFDWPSAAAISVILVISTGSVMLALAMLARHPRLVGHV